MPRASDPGIARVGDAGAGPSAFVDAAATVLPLHDDWSVSWWIGAEDRWHVPATEASCRQRRVDAMPVMETVIKVPGGEAVARTYGALLAGSGRGVVLEVANASAVPFAVAFVATSPRPVVADPGGLRIDGVVRVRLSKPASRYAAAASIDALLAELEAERFAGEAPEAKHGSVALILPVPHRTSVACVIDPAPAPAPRRRGREAALPIDRSTVPDVAKVVAGWSALVARGVRLALDDDAETAAFDEARADVLMGADPSADAVELAAVATASARLGWADETVELVDALLDSQKLDGRIDSAEPLDATTRFLEVCAALWSAGAPNGQMELLVGPIAKAGHWLGRGRRRPEVLGAAAGRASTALRGVGPALRAVGQPDVADDLAAFAGVLDTAATDAVRSASAGGVVGSADRVVARLDAVITETADGLDVFGAWTPARRGVALEAHGVPTRWGVASVALRWHGPRPALLWEVVAHGDRTSSDEPVWRAPRLDPAWQASAARGDALLGEPSGFAG